MLKLTSLAGLLFFIGAVWLFSEDRKRFPSRPLLWGLFANFLVVKGTSHLGYTGQKTPARSTCLRELAAGGAGHEWKAVAQILGERVVPNEFIGYVHLAEAKSALSERSYRITSYALCGFANLGSIAVQIGGIGAIVPSRSKDLARLGLKAMSAMGWFLVTPPRALWGSSANPR